MLSLLITFVGISLAFVLLAHLIIWWLGPLVCDRCGRTVPDEAYTSHRARCGEPRTEVRVTTP